MYGNYGYKHDSLEFLGFSVFTVIVFIILYLIIMGIVAYVFDEACKRKGYFYGEGHVFAAVFWLGIFGCLYAICLPDLNNRNENKTIYNEKKAVNDNTETKKTEKFVSDEDRKKMLEDFNSEELKQKKEMYIKSIREIEKRSKMNILENYKSEVLPLLTISEIKAVENDWLNSADLEWLSYFFPSVDCFKTVEEYKEKIKEINFDLS